jgi:phosphoribosylanthranilate isomerase
VRTRIKICGVRRPADAAVAVAAGADAIGLVFADSPRRVTFEEARAVTSAVPAPVARVGVFVDASEEQVAQAVAACGLTHVQFHGSESPERCAGAPVPVIKAFRVGSGFDFGALEPYRATVSALLLDSCVPGSAGGTGRSFDWGLLAEALLWAPVILAGGLRPDNVGRAIATARPFAVDVSSGVEVRPGEKDPVVMEAFVRAVARADREAS